MSIANEIQRIQSAKANIKIAIEQKGVTVGDGTIDTYAAKIGEISGGGSGDYEQGFEDGKNSVVPIERYLRTAQFISLNIFAKSDVVLNLDTAESFNNLCSIQSAENINTTVEHLTVNCPNLVTTLNNAFYCGGTNVDKTLKRLTFNVNTQNVTTFNNSFSGLQALEVVDGTSIDFSANTQKNINNSFSRCSSLIEFRVVEKSIKYSFGVSSSPNLSTETTQSIIDGLADLTGSTAQTLTLHSTVGGKLTDEQKATITAKNWALVY